MTILTEKSLKEMPKGFDHVGFSSSIKEELKYTGYLQEDLATSIYVEPRRITALLTNRQKYKEFEVARISKVLGIEIEPFINY